MTTKKCDTCGDTFSRHHFNTAECGFKDSAVPDYPYGVSVTVKSNNLGLYRRAISSKEIVRMETSREPDVCDSCWRDLLV